MFERFQTGKIPIFMDFDSLIKYHFGIFAFTGGGKSNLLANLIRKIVYNTKDNKIFIKAENSEDMIEKFLEEVIMDDNI